MKNYLLCHHALLPSSTLTCSFPLFPILSKNIWKVSSFVCAPHKSPVASPHMMEHHFTFSDDAGHGSGLCTRAEFRILV